MKKVLSILVLALVAVQLPLPVMLSLRMPSSFR